MPGEKVYCSRKNAVPFETPRSIDCLDQSKLYDIEEKEQIDYTIEQHVKVRRKL